MVADNGRKKTEYVVAPRSQNKHSIKNDVGCMDSYNTNKVKENLVADNSQKKNENMKERNLDQVKLLVKNGDKRKVKLAKHCPGNYPVAESPHRCAKYTWQIFWKGLGSMLILSRMAASWPMTRNYRSLVDKRLCKICRSTKDIVKESLESLGCFASKLSRLLFSCGIYRYLRIRVYGCGE